MKIKFFYEDIGFLTESQETQRMSLSTYRLTGLFGGKRKLQEENT